MTNSPEDAAASTTSSPAAGKRLRTDYPYAYFGAHWQGSRTTFRLFAPAASEVFLMRQTAEWRREKMERRPDGVWELALDEDLRGTQYKYWIKNENDYLQHPYAMARIDPFSPQLTCESGPGGSRIFNSLVCDPDSFAWTCKHARRHTAPMSIYELHLSTFWSGGYREIARKIVDHVGYLGFTHVQVMPPFQTPIHESWGYLVGCPYAINERYGTLDDFKYLVNLLHESNLGVIVDVPLGFGIQDWDCGLGSYDGTDLYHHAGARGWNNQWNTRVYNHQSRYVRDYLLGICTYLYNELGVDGARIDAVSSQIFFDYDRGFWDWPRNDKNAFTPEQWDTINRLGGDRWFENRGYFLSETLDFDAIDFFKEFHRRLATTAPAFVTIAEESRRVFPNLATPVEHGGLGFTYAQNMGEMHRVRKCLRRELDARTLSEIDEIVFSHAPEVFVNPMNTHDECANGKTRLVSELGNHLRLIGLAALCWFRPGAPMLFQGDEFCEEGWFDVWHGLDWSKTGPAAQLHQQQMLNCIHDLNHLMRAEPAFACQRNWDIDRAGSNNELKYFAWIRWGGSGRWDDPRAEDHRDDLVFVRNEAGCDSGQNVQVRVPAPGAYRVIFNSIDERYIGRQGYNEHDPYWTVHTGDCSLWLRLHPYQNLALKLVLPQG